MFQVSETPHMLSIPFAPGLQAGLSYKLKNEAVESNLFC
jgi:hypothetical protein